MTLTMVKPTSANDDGDDCERLRARLAAAKERTARARRALETRRASVEVSLRERLQSSEQQLADLESQFATAMELVREAAQLEVERILREGEHALAPRRSAGDDERRDGGDVSDGLVDGR